MFQDYKMNPVHPEKSCNPEPLAKLLDGVAFLKRKDMAMNC
jgi:hypothetical protein